MERRRSDRLLASSGLEDEGGGIGRLGVEEEVSFITETDGAVG